jgi:farnesyl-diphosphate farnesyltransferase
MSNRRLRGGAPEARSGGEQPHDKQELGTAKPSLLAQPEPRAAGTFFGSRSLGLPIVADDAAWCRAVLPCVSRTFALTIRLLPPRLELPVTVAYLLCRIADTIEDDPQLEPADKAALLAEFRDRLDDGTPAATVARYTAAPADDDQAMTAQSPRVLAVYRALPAVQRAAIAPWVREMCDGMADFAKRCPPSGPTGLRSLRSVEDLDRYCYYVAGTVGHLLTALFLADRPLPPAARARLEGLANAFGLGLQLTNIIKDVADDRRRGWSFVPSDFCHEIGLDPEQFLSAGNEAQARAVMARMITKADGHLAEALAYTLALPRRWYRVRLFCLTPLCFAVATLRRAESDPELLDPDHKVKISRDEVKRIVRSCFARGLSNRLSSALYRRLGGR